MTSAISPAGGKLTGAPPAGAAKAGDAVPHTKTPDEAQTAAAEGEASPATVMVAGTPAGGPEDSRSGQRHGKKKKGEAGAKHPGEEGEEEKKEEKAAKDGERQREGAGGRGTRRFGRNLGDRGAAAARAASNRLRARAGAMRVNEGAGSRIGAARAAAEPPANAAEAAGQQQQTESLQSAEIPAPDEVGARDRSRAAVAANVPATIEDLDNFSSGGGQIGEGLTNSIAAEAQSQTAPVNEQLSAVSAPPPGPEPPAAVEQPEPMPAGASAAPALSAAAPPPVPEDSLDASEFREEADGALSEHDVDDATLERADEGPLHEIGADKRELNENVESASTDARASESAANETAHGALADAEMSTDADMAARRGLGQTAVSAEQDATRTGDQTGRQSLADRINQIYSGVEQEVTGKLASLQTDAVQQFREAQGQRLESFKSGVRSDLSAFKDRRYSGMIRGTYRRVRDWALGINDLPEVKALYERHRDQYIADIDQLLATIRTSIERIVAECKAALQRASQEIETLASSSRTQLDADAQAALTRARGQFRQMERNIDSAARAANAALDQERKRAIAAMDAALEEIRAENAGLAERIAAAIRALARLLGTFMRLMARITRMGIGAFLGAALDQAKSGVQNHLWGELQEAFKQWLFMKMPVIQLLLNMPPNLLEMLTTLASSIIGMFTENLPALLPAIGVAAMTWLAITLASKLIPGVGAIMAVIDAIRAAWALVQSLLSAAAAFFDFVMKVANRENGAVSFARALAYGIVAAVDAILTFLGVDALIRRVVSAIARPFQRIFGRIATRFRDFMARRRQRRGERRAADRRQRDGRPGDANRHASARSQARAERRAERRRDAERQQSRDRSQDPRRRRENESDRRRRQQQERERRAQERLDRAVAVIEPSVNAMLRGGASAFRFRAALLLWRVRYRLSSLSMTPSGQLEASVNPRKTFSRARNIPARELGRILRPILRRAEETYLQARRNDPVRSQRVNDAAARARTGGDFDPATGAPLTRGERAEVFSRAPIPSAAPGVPATNVGDGVMARQDVFPGSTGSRSPSHTIVDIPGGGHSWPAIQATLSQLRQSSGLGTADIARFLAAPRSQQATIATELGLSPANVGYLRSVSTLIDLERGRRGPEGTAQLLGLSLAGQGGATLTETLGDTRSSANRTSHGYQNPNASQSVSSVSRGSRAGMLAPVTMTQAQSTVSAPSRHYRIGRLFQRLELAASNSQLVDNGQPGSLARIEQAVNNFLRRRLSSNSTITDAAANALVAELVAFLNALD